MATIALVGGESDQPFFREWPASRKFAVDFFVRGIACGRLSLDRKKVLRIRFEERLQHRGIGGVQFVGAERRRGKKWRGVGVHA